MSGARPSRPGGWQALACVAVVAASVAATSVAAGCGGSQSAARGSGRLEWVRPPRVVELAAGRARRDFIAFGEVRNASLRPLDLNARALKVRVAGGRELPTTAAFQRTFARGVFPLNRGPEPIQEDYRLGLRTRLDPGERAPLVVAWREPRGGGGRARGPGDPRGARTLDYGSGTLPLR